MPTNKDIREFCTLMRGGTLLSELVRRVPTVRGHKSRADGGGVPPIPAPSAPPARSVITCGGTASCGGAENPAGEVTLDAVRSAEVGPWVKGGRGPARRCVPDKQSASSLLINNDISS